jgi:hypothetical protein
VKVFVHVVVFDAHALDPISVANQLHAARRIADFDAALLGRLGLHLHEAGAAADGFDRQPAPEFELAVDLERLTAVDRNETDALLA